MSNYRTLENVLEKILQVVKPLQEDWETRTQVIAELRRVIGSVESLRGARVEPFGSFASNLFTRWADLDISIDLLNSSCISSAGKRRKQRLLGDIQKALRERGGWRRLQCIPNARVPILKFESSLQGISCDVSIDNLQGQIKSKLLLWISAIDARFHDMVLLVKEWAKAHDINNPKTGTFNSYSLSLLVIFHFQTCVPAILPPLKDICTGNIADDLQVPSDYIDLLRPLSVMSYKLMQRYSRKLSGSRFLRMDDTLIVEAMSLFCTPFGYSGAGKDLVGLSSVPSHLDWASMDLMGESREGLDVTFEVTPRKVKGRKELKYLECTIKYDAKGISIKRGKGKPLVF